MGQFAERRLSDEEIEVLAAAVRDRVAQRMTYALRLTYMDENQQVHYLAEIESSFIPFPGMTIDVPTSNGNHVLVEVQPSAQVNLEQVEPGKSLTLDGDRGGAGHLGTHYISTVALVVKVQQITTAEELALLRQQAEELRDKLAKEAAESEGEPAGTSSNPPAHGTDDVPS